MFFSDLPHDVQINILSFLGPSEISAFACTCRRFAALCSRSSRFADIWLALYSRRWGCSETQLRRLSGAELLQLYKTLDVWEQFTGFSHRVYRGVAGKPSLVLIERSSSCIIGYRISPSAAAASYAVCKTPFLWLGVSAAGETLSYLCPNNLLSGSDVIPVEIYFVGRIHFVVWPEGRRAKYENFVKILDYKPTPTRPLQGLWKGISEDMNLVFYLVTYDDVGGITCRRIGDSAEAFSDCPVVFLTSNSTFLESPFSKEELAIYGERKHLGSLSSMDMEVVSRILCINFSYDVDGSSGDPRFVEGRIWLYQDGTFGFGFLENDFIVDLKHISLDGHILDDVESSHQT